MDLPDVGGIGGLTGLLAGAGGLGILARLGLRGMGQKREEKAEAALRQRRAEELVGTYTLRPVDDIWERVTGNGENAFVWIGSLPTSLGPYVLHGFERCGSQSHIGQSLMAQLNAMERDRCFEAMPEVFRSRFTPVVCDPLSGGFQGRIFEEAMAIRHLWFNDVKKAVNDWLDEIDRHDKHELLIVMLSPGAHSAIYPTVISLYRDRHPDTPVYIVTALDDGSIVRERFPLIRSLYTTIGDVKGTLLVDNKRSKIQANLGLSTLLPAMSVGNWLDISAPQLGNVLSRVFSSQRNVTTATLAVWGESIPVKYHPADSVNDAVYTTRSALLQEKVTRGIKTVVEQPALQSVPLTAAGLRHARYVYASLPLIPEPDLRDLSDLVSANLKEWLSETDPELRVYFTSTGQELTSETTTTPIVITMFQPLADDGTEIDQLARDAHRIETRFISKSVIKRSEVKTLVTSGQTPPTPAATRSRGRPKGRSNA